jgi:hypothetical protein
LKLRILSLFALAAVALACGDEFTKQEATSSGPPLPTTSSGAGAAGGGGGGGGAPDPCGHDAVCVAAATDGWLGPVVVYVGVDAPPACDPIWASELSAHAGNITAEFSCDSCACGVPAGAICTPTEVTGYGVPDCASTGGSYTLPADGMCWSTSGHESVKTKEVVAQGGLCAVSGGGLMASPIQWELSARICGEPQALTSCGAGVCAPKAMAPFGAAACVYQEGQTGACPQEYPNRQIIYSEALDTRTCSVCGCGAPAGVDCGVAFTAYANSTTCGSGATPLADSGCTNSTAGSFSSIKFTGQPQGGACPVTGGLPTGAVEPANPITVCCAE